MQSSIVSSCKHISWRIFFLNLTFQTISKHCVRDNLSQVPLQLQFRCNHPVPPSFGKHKTVCNWLEDSNCDITVGIRPESSPRPFIIFIYLFIFNRCTCSLSRLIQSLLFQVALAVGDSGWLNIPVFIKQIICLIDLRRILTDQVTVDDTVGKVQWNKT